MKIERDDQAVVRLNALIDAKTPELSEAGFSAIGKLRLDRLPG
jgi:hypothetical protein